MSELNFEFWLLNWCLNWDLWFVIRTHQNEVGLIRGQHENGDVVVGQRRDDRLGDFGDADGLRGGSVASARHHVERQPGGVGDADVLRLGQLWWWTETDRSAGLGPDRHTVYPQWKGTGRSGGVRLSHCLPVQTLVQSPV